MHVPISTCSLDDLLGIIPSLLPAFSRIGLGSLQQLVAFAQVIDCPRAEPYNEGNNEDRPAILGQQLERTIPFQVE